MVTPCSARVPDTVEGYPIKHAGVSGNTALRDGSLLRALQHHGLSAGGRYDAHRLQQALADIVHTYQHASLPLQTVTPVLTRYRDNAVSLDVRIDDRTQVPGPVGVGPVGAGPVAAGPATDPAETVAGDVFAFAGWAHDEGVVFGAGANQPDPGGKGDEARVYLRRTRVRQTADLRYRFPTFSSTRTGLTLRAYHETERPYRSSQNRQGYRLSTQGLQAIAHMHAGGNDRLDIGLGLAQLDVRLKAPYLVPRAYLDFLRSHGHRNHIIIATVDWRRERVEGKIWPTRGYRLGLGLKAGLPLGGIQFLTLQHHQQWFVPVADDLTLAFRAVAGYGTGYGKTRTLPFFYRLGDSAAGSVRGYQSDSLGPKYIAHFQGSDQRIRRSKSSSLGGRFQAFASIELAFPLPPLLQGRKDMRLSLFTDAGSVWDGRTYSGPHTPYTRPHRSSFDRELRVASGLAFSWQTSLGSLQLSYAVAWRTRPGDRREPFRLDFSHLF